jgi:hypothetical protein
LTITHSDFDFTLKHVEFFLSVKELMCSISRKERAALENSQIRLQLHDCTNGWERCEILSLFVGVLVIFFPERIYIKSRST